MGACLSSTGDYSITTVDKSTSAFVIPIKGDLRRYPTPVFVSEVLQIETPSSMSSFFLCNSDNLYYDEQITALDTEDELDAGQIYFILPNSMLGHHLSASDMAALAVKASVTLDSSANSASTSSSNAQKRKNKARISPLVWMETSQINVTVEEEGSKKNYIYKQQNASLGVSRSGSIRKTQRYCTRKGRLAVGSFKLRLSTIYESECSDELQIN